ncbi:MAG: 2-ketoglutarate ferredoxin oxidoreductase subunit beta, partial [Halobacteria archaeon]|nr:2-ketoglutarate ferredoxin oxidoreductase subunit beta [Halobacteria archaeon]
EGLYEGKVLTGRYYADDRRPSYQDEKQERGDLPDTPVAEQYFDDSYSWDRSHDIIDKHK